MIESTATPAVMGLRYIASSLPERYDGYSEETIAIAKAALEQIAELESELARVKAEKWFVTDLDKVKEERDELKSKVDFLQRNNDACADDSELIRLAKERDDWKAVAGRLARCVADGETLDEQGEAIAEFDRLQSKSP